MGRFKLLRGLPYIYDLQTIGIKTDCTKTYDYRSRLGHVAERDLQTKFPSRAHKDKRINMFESREIGIGAAREEDDMAEREKLKKLQVSCMIFDTSRRFPKLIAFSSCNATVAEVCGRTKSTIPCRSTKANRRRASQDYGKFHRCSEKGMTSNIFHLLQMNLYCIYSLLLGQGRRKNPRRGRSKESVGRRSIAF